MKGITWSEKYSVGSLTIDSHHKKLIDYINQLDESITSRSVTTDLLLDIVKLLKEYTNFHFALEERLMQENEYPDYEIHKAEHQDFVKEIDTFNDVLGRGQEHVDHKMTDYLKGWLLEHIMGSDQKYADFFRARGVEID